MSKRRNVDDIAKCQILSGLLSQNTYMWNGKSSGKHNNSVKVSFLTNCTAADIKN